MHVAVWRVYLSGVYRRGSSGPSWPRGCLEWLVAFTEPVRIAVPSKGRLREPALALLSRAGFSVSMGSDRFLMAPTSTPWVHLVFVRPEDVPWIVATGAADLGVTGLDYAVESGAGVEPCLRLGFGRARLSVAVPAEAGYRGVGDLEGARVATKYVRIASEFFASRGVRVEIVPIHGAAEVMPRLGAADAIVDVVSTGTTLRVHGLVELETVMETEAVMVARRCGQLRREAGDALASVEAALNAARYRMVMMNVPGDKLESVLEVLPSMAAPAVTRLHGTGMWEVITAVPVEELASVVAEARRRGARDVAVLEVERLYP